MEHLKKIKEQIIEQIEAQMCNLKSVNTQELGAAIDMVKDLEEAIYYCTIVKAMGKESKEKHNYQQEQLLPPHITDRNVTYYTDSSTHENNKNVNMEHVSSFGGHKTQHHTEELSTHKTHEHMDQFYPIDKPISMDMTRDLREGKSPISRRHYMESKEMHKDRTIQMKDLEKYVQELAADVLEMIKDASAEERQLLQSKIQMLANKIATTVN